MPAEAGEAGEVVIRRTQLCTILDRQGSKVSVGGEISGGSDMLQQTSQDAGVLRPRMGDGHGRMMEPVFHEGKSRIDAERLVVQSCSCGDAKESEDHDPREEQCFAARKRFFQPGKRRPIKRRVSIHGIDKKVGVREYHFPFAIFRRISWSSSSEASWSALSTLK